jgi:hypothetical protein
MFAKLVDGAKVWWHFAEIGEWQPKFMRTGKYGAVKTGSEDRRSTTTEYGGCMGLRVVDVREKGRLAIQKLDMRAARSRRW